jgi:F-type H+-transporting ATPase subunit gamma
MVASYKKLHRKLQGYIRFQDVTKAVRFVTGGELGKIKKKLKRRFTALSSFLPLFSKKYVQAEFQKTLVVPISDDRGSCGAHNNYVMNASKKLLSFLEEANKEFKVYAIGKKIMDFLKRFYRRMLVGYSLGLTDVKFSIDICIFFILKFLRWSWDRLYILFNRYYTLQVQRPVVYRLHSYESFLNNIYRNMPGRYAIYYTSVVDRSSSVSFMTDLYNFSLSIFLVDALNENKFSFLGGRFTAMDNAVKNSQDVIDRLRIAYNKARQEYITTELVEIVACAESINLT